MQISASTGPEGNPGNNIGNFLQMIQSMSAGQPDATGSTFTNLAGGSVDGNPFSQILLQQIFMLLKASGVEMPDASASKDELIAAFKKLLEDGQTQADGTLSELAVLAMAGQQLIENSGNSLNSSAEVSSDSTEAVGATGSGNVKNFLPAGQLTSLIVQAIQESLKESNSKGNAPSDVKTGVLQGMEALAQSKKDGIQKDAAGSDKTAFSDNLKSLFENSNGEADGSKTPGLNEVAGAKTDNSAGITNQADQKAALFSEAAKEAATEQMNAKQKNIAAGITGEKPAAENSLVESQLGKAGANVKVMMPEQGAKPGGSNGLKTQDDQSTVLKVADPDGQDAKKTISADANVIHNDRRMAGAGNETKNSMAGKDMNPGAALAMDSQEVTDKVRTELKGKTGAVDKNSENNYLNSAAVSAGVQAKEGSGDTSSTSIINRVAAEFRENMISEGGRVKITLTPPSLGSLEMDVSVVNNKVKVMLIAENKDVQKMLSGSIETLKTTLQTQGLTIERCDVMMQDSRDEYPQGFSGQQAFGQEQASRERNSGRETPDDEPLARPTVGSIQGPARRPQYTGTESISLFA